MISEKLKCSECFKNVEKIIEENRLPHSFLIEGGSFEIRKEFGEYIANAIVCEGESRPCGNCRQCSLFANGANVDISYILPEDGKKNILISAIRSLREDAFIKPHSAQKRIFIIETAELMTEQSQNALLKILEEPPESVVFILLTPSRGQLLDTIVSRCSVFKLSDDFDLNDNLTVFVTDFLKMLFDSSEYDMLKILSAFEKDRMKSEDFFKSLQSECVRLISSNSISNFRLKVLSRIYDKCNEYIELIHNNINMSLLFTVAVCEFKSYL